MIEWAEQLITRWESDPQALSDDLINWYPSAAMWIEPGPPATPSTDPPCFLCGNLTFLDGTTISEGALYIFLKQMTAIQERLYGWINNLDTGDGLNKGYQGSTCTEVWCVPDSSLTGYNCGTDGCKITAAPACVEIPREEGEQETFNTNMTFDSATDVTGDVADIVGCLNYNVDGYDHVAAEAFKLCYINQDIPDRKSTRLNSSHIPLSRMPSSA